MSGFYDVTVGSLPDYDELVAEIYINDGFIGLIRQEKGPNSAVFEFAPTRGSDTVKVDLVVLESAVAEAKQRLFDMRRAPTAGE